MKFPPALTYALSTACDCASSAVQPNTLPPRQRGNTLSWVRPSEVRVIFFCMPALSCVRALGLFPQSSPPHAPEGAAGAVRRHHAVGAGGVLLLATNERRGDEPARQPSNHR